MRIYDVTDSDGRAFAFEVSNLLLGRRAACRMASRIAGARIVRRPRAFSWLREAPFCEFEVTGVRFEIEEPLGDSSRYWIGPVPPRPVTELASVREAFARVGLLAGILPPAC
ncbi:MAG: hypothetical protein WKG32_03940 [Gemmatimonadaceae bacterium]